MPLIQISIMEGREKDKIEQLIHNVTETVSKTLDAPKTNIRVLITEFPKSHWGIAGKAAEKLNR